MTIIDDRRTILVPYNEIKNGDCFVFKTEYYIKSFYDDYKYGTALNDGRIITFVGDESVYPVYITAHVED